MVAPAQAHGVQDAVARLERTLLDAASPDGGWAYQPGNRPRLEPTIWALLALSGRLDLGDADERARRFLHGCRRADGLFVDLEGVPPNFAVNGQAALLFHADPAAGDAAAVLEALTSVYGIQVQNSVIQQDGSLRGWPWVDATFSWVEPTAWCMLALKAGATRNGSALVQARIAEAERLLFDRSCRPAGWNYGNSVVLGQSLRAFVPTTAVALLALQDRRSHPVVERGLDYLRDHRLEQTSGMGLALTVLCLRAYELAAPDVERALIDVALEPELSMNLHAAAMSLCALDEVARGHQLFRL